MLPLRKLCFTALTSLALVGPDFASAQAELTLKDIVLLAENNNISAQFSLGEAYRTGDGVAQDYSEAVRWYKLASKGGSANAQFALGGLIAEGLGAEQDLKSAFSLFESSAKAGHMQAALVLGTMIEKGLGTDLPPETAVKWYKIAAEGGVGEGATNLGVLYQTGEIVPQDFALAQSWYQRGANLGDARAINNLGVMFMRGEGVPQDPTEAAKYFKAGVAAGSTESMTNLASLYDSALGVPLDEAKADALYRQAADATRKSRTADGLPDAAEIKKIVSAPGFTKQAVQNAAKAGDPRAQYVLGHLHMNGWGTPQDYVSAYAWLNLASAGKSDTSVRDTLSERMTPSQINKAQALARQFNDSISDAE